VPCYQGLCERATDRDHGENHRRSLTRLGPRSKDFNGRSNDERYYPGNIPPLEDGRGAQHQKEWIYGLASLSLLVMSQRLSAVQAARNRLRCTLISANAVSRGGEQFLLEPEIPIHKNAVTPAAARFPGPLCRHSHGARTRPGRLQDGLAGGHRVSRPLGLIAGQLCFSHVYTCGLQNDKYTLVYMTNPIKPPLAALCAPVIARRPCSGS